MTPQSKKVLKIVAISVGAILIVTAGVIIVYKITHKDDQGDDKKDNSNPNASNQTGGTKPTGTKSNPEYSVEQIKNMQLWLMRVATIRSNSYILGRIKDTGGIDGKMGDGFNDSLKEAIRVGWVNDLFDLYRQSNN